MNKGMFPTALCAIALLFSACEKKGADGADRGKGRRNCSHH